MALAGTKIKKRSGKRPFRNQKRPFRSSKRLVSESEKARFGVRNRCFGCRNSRFGFRNGRLGVQTGTKTDGYENDCNRRAKDPWFNFLAGFGQAGALENHGFSKLSIYKKITKTSNLVFKVTNNLHKIVISEPFFTIL